ncbi:MAG: hypothetical protein F6J87_17440 [Spirulina sp. SIO3F2]|nr:hypothetical protein [Spirulina sp. SIO3F2]
MKSIASIKQFSQQQWSKLQLGKRCQLLTVLSIGLLSGGLLRSDQAIALNRHNTPTKIPAIDKTQSPKAQGLHFYGQAPEANAIGQDYLLFDVQGKQVSGVIFQPQSEYACFQGEVTPQGLELAIADPFEGTTVPYAIAFTHETVQVAGALQSRTTLEGFTEIAAVGPSEQALLAQCR